MIIWNEEKNINLKIERGISFEEVSDIILNKSYLDILQNPARPHQKIFVVELFGYICAVPFVIDEFDSIVLKTVYPSRKLAKKYRSQKNEKNKIE
jgi:uncharacterized DUF497 family protein